MSGNESTALGTRHLRAKQCVMYATLRAPILKSHTHPTKWVCGYGSCPFPSQILLEVPSLPISDCQAD